MIDRRSIGERGENLAVRYLSREGYTLIERNYRTRQGEIDLILRDEKSLVFVEVKLRRGMNFGDPLEAVTPKKQTRIRLVAEQYLAKQGEDFVSSFEEMRFDVVGILLTRSGKPQIQHVKDAF